ncbi:MAG: PBP1A family penicillin-binding protein [Acidobacteriota bacterium]
MSDAPRLPDDPEQRPPSDASTTDDGFSSRTGLEPPTSFAEGIETPASSDPPAERPSSSGTGPARRPTPIDDEPVRGIRWRRYLLVLPIATIVLAIVTGVVFAASIHRPQVDDVDQFVPRLVTEVSDHRGQIIANYSRENRVMLEEDELPPLLQHAIVATEDANFFEHGGVDALGIVRAMIANVRAGRRVEGASTITMQLARTLFQLTREKSWWRKIEEAFLAVELEKSYSKQQILTLYANLVNLGHGNYGMEAAARAFFNKSVAQLTLPEAATLAGIPQRPSAFSPYRAADLVVERRNWVLRRMLTEGYITQQQHDAARAEPLLVVQRQKKEAIGPYFSEDVRRHLIDTYGETQLYDRGLLVDTTLDRQIQRAAEEALRDQLVRLDHAKGWRGIENQLDAEDLEERTLPSWGGQDPLPGQWIEGLVLDAGSDTATVKIRDTNYTLDRRGIEWTGKRRPDRLLARGNVAWFRFEEAGDDLPPILHLEQEPELEGAVLVLESKTGAVRAMVGGWSYERNEFNRVTQARRQVGSAFKPFVFAKALEDGYTAADTLFDGPVVFPGSSPTDAYSPRNYYRKYYGITTVRRAIEQSVNVTSVKMLDLLGADDVIELARRCGITSELLPYPSLALGAADLTPLELAAAYAVFANGGTYVEPYLIETVTSRDGRVLESHLARAHKALDATHAYIMMQMLRGVAVRGTAASDLNGLGIETGGKTGTTDDYSDAWFVGSTPRYTILTWVGYDQTRPIGRGMTGAAAALPIWSALVRSGLEDGWLQPGETFPAPPGIETAQIDSRSGLLWGPAGERSLMETFVEGTVPQRLHDPEAQRVLGMPWYLQEPFYLPKEGEKMPGDTESWEATRESWSRSDG